MSVTVTLPDGSELAVEAGSTVEDVAYEIGPGLGRDTVAGVVDGEFVAKEHPIEKDVEIEIVTESSDEYLDALRHSAAHVFAQALQRLHSEATLTIGPWTDDGFYYDVTGVELDEADLEEISAEAEEIIEADLPIERVEMSREEAFEYYEDNPFKREILEEEAAGEDPVSFYEQAEFRDLCRGPHVASTGEIGGFALLEISGAYWRGTEDNEMLTRVYGTAFPSESELEEFLDRREQAKERDHRKIGREMDLFSVPDHSPGCPHYHPNGMTIRRELEEYIRTQNDALGYEEVRTPELNKKELWEESGHLDFFGSEGEFFLWEENETEYGLKPMNCANHAYIYDQQVRSYRDLPVRFSEFGNVYRNEQSGELSGLLRVRGMTQDDGHAFIRRDQIQTEITETLRVIEEIYEQFDFEVLYKLETKGDHAVGSDEVWAEATEALRNALEAEGLEYDVEEGEASFYGPKIGLDARDTLGREWTIGTVQLDFNIPERLDLSYTGEDNEEHRPVMVHRALLGSFERFMGVMIEHFNGKFPTWLAPEQVRILPISDDNVAYAEEIREVLSDFRVGIEDRSWTIGKKIQTAHDDRVPYMLIVGGNEEAAGTISVRDRFERERGDVSPEEFRTALETEVEEKRTEPGFLG
ncbi:threonine--tRNA ligase [Halalkalicoccus jeotgali]|uniref:Threonine--tRNA ligase n=1 Tax=Halalkalicoccus jeotgali (strain DSM 18796 / CECT 7217 / JCM 14584 / KCTC 4019 / B3) TaxID=795797 RepID=D8J4V5_HALJB|nr:threonine--tRNA ligase [Halalkalicoccus jeotgali]ADJ15572.1 threonyl-tRNA synthetase [Halalkalicoccus jeotgali B3]ELY36020.1 threonyl-tRNA ligase [Halalkalicoccus jeotgali B3]